MQSSIRQYGQTGASGEFGRTSTSGVSHRLTNTSLKSQTLRSWGKKSGDFVERGFENKKSLRLYFNRRLLQL